MREFKFALIGAGFWSKYQLAAWGEVAGARCVAVCDTSLEKAQLRAQQVGVDTVYTHVEQLLDQQSLDFVDIVTSVEAHAAIASLAMRRGVAAICQKPLAQSLAAARQLCAQSEQLKVPLLVHENWRWQAPLRRIKAILDSGRLGNLVRARIDYANSFPVFENQPALKCMPQFILADMGTHILDLSRCLFGEATELYCQTRRIHDDIVGEDVATVMMRKASGLTVTCNMSYASRWEFDCFPQTMIAVEGTHGGVSLTADFQICVFDAHGQHRERVAIEQFDWINPAYAVVHSSMVACHRNLLAGLRGDAAAESTCHDNLRTLRLVYSAYESAQCHNSVTIGED